MRNIPLILLTASLVLVNSFNIDTGKAKVLSGKAGDYFGYAVAFHKSGNKFW